MCKSLQTLKNNIAKGSRRLSKVTIKNIINAGEFERIELGYYYDGYEVQQGGEIENPIEWFNNRYDSLDCGFRGVKDGIVEIHLTVHSNLWYDLYINLNKDYSKKSDLEQTASTQETPVNNDTDITVTYNEEKNGIELRFSEKPAEEVRDQLKANNFRYSKYQNMWYAKDTEERREFVNTLININKNGTENNELHTNDTIELNAIEDAEILESITVIEEVATDTEKLPDANDFNNILTLRDKYITNWNVLSEELQNFILNCDKYWVNLQSVELYKDNKIVASIGVSRWEDTIEVNSIGAGELFQWNIQEGFTVNNLIQENSNINYNDPEVKTWEEVSSKYELINFENIEIIDVLDKNIFVNCLVPSLNKNNTKQLNDEEINESSYLNKFQVQKIVKLNQKQYNYFIENLLNDYSFLTSLGGWEEDDNHNLLHFYGVAIVCDNEETLIIDPSGTSYARYTCQLVEDIENNLQTELNTLNTTININNNLYNEAINSIVNNELYEIKVSDKIVISDERYIKNIPCNGLTVVTGHTIRELIVSGEGINILNLQPLKMRIEQFTQGLKKHDNKEVFSLFPSETDKQLENIKFLDRLEYELNRANQKEDITIIS